MPRTMPFGFARGYVAQVPAPRTGMTVNRVGYSETLELLNGGAYTVDSAGKHKVYGMSFSGDAAKLDGLGVFSDFASGLFGRGLLQFSDPMNYDTNLLPEHWAAPHLHEHGWKAPIIGTPSFSNNTTPSAASPYPRRVSWNLTGGVGEMPTHPSKVATILIPPGYNLHLGFSGVAAGSALMRYLPIRVGGALGGTSDIPLLPIASMTQMNTVVDGDVNQAVEIYATRGSLSAGTLLITSGMAQLWPKGITPLLDGRPKAGQGHTGVRFADGAQQETYVMTRGHYKQLSTSLVEVGAWA